MLLASWKFLESYVFERVGERHGKGNEEFSDFAKKNIKSTCVRLLLIFFLKPSSNFNSLSPSYTEICLHRRHSTSWGKSKRSFLDNRMILIANKQFNEISTNIVKHIQYICMILCFSHVMWIYNQLMRYNHSMYFLAYSLKLYDLISYLFFKF